LQLNVTEHISASMQILESAAPLPSIRELGFWQSAPVQVPGQDEPVHPPAGVTAAASTQAAQDPLAETPRISGKAKKSQSKRPPDMALTFALRTMQQSLSEIIGKDAVNGQSVKSKEAEQADRMKALGAVPMSGNARGAKRGPDETVKDPAKQARFAM
jgi:hypothetical protein